MRYWPLSEITPHLHHAQTWELICSFHDVRMSESTIMACNHVASQMPVRETSLVIIESVGAPMRRVYTECPKPEDWLKLERAGFVASENFFGFIIDALH